MINISWEGDKQLHDALSYVESRIDKKLSWNLNGMAFAANQKVKQELPSWLDMGRGANFIKQSFVFDKSTPDNLSITLGALERLWLASLLEEGGTRLPQKKAITIPVKRIAKNISEAYKKPGVFSANIGNVAGLWQRVKKKKMSTLSLVYAFEDRTQYKGNNIEFYDTVSSYFEANVDEMVRKSVEELVLRFNSK